jgi:hypothetical protein
MGSNQQLRWCGERLAVSAAWPPVLLFGSRENGLWRSPDGGKTWATVSMPTPQADCRELPADSDAWHMQKAVADM